MNNSEKYTIYFGDGHPLKYSEHDIEQIWSREAGKAALESGVSISAAISEASVICNESSACTSGELIRYIRVVCIRNPVFCMDAKEYRTILMGIAWNVKQALGEIYLAVVEEEVKFTYFTKR